MPATKVASTLLVSQSLAAGGTINAAELNLSTAYAGQIFVKLTNGATAPTTAPTVTFYTGEATGIKRVKFITTGDTTNSSINDRFCQYGLADMFANVTILNGATNPITVEIYASSDTAI